MDCKYVLNLKAAILFLTLVYCDDTLPPYEIAGKTFEEYPLPKLPYGFRDLEPFIDEDTVRAHYNGHHETYRKKMNNILQQWRLDNASKLPHQDLFTVLRALDEIPKSFKEGVQNNVGGFVNHALYWSILSPNTDKIIRKPTNNLLNLFEKHFTSFEQFKEIFTSKALSLFGSGYVWLVCDDVTSMNGQLFILSSTNQDCPISMNMYPLLVIDVWEHAYYLKHQFKRSDYVTDFWSLVDWNNVEKLWTFWNSREKLSDKKEEL